MLFDVPVHELTAGDGDKALLTADGDTRSDIKLPRSLPPPEVPGAEELSQKICDLLKEEKGFYVIVQVACGTEQIMDIKVMTEAK